MSRSVRHTVFDVRTGRAVAYVTCTAERLSQNVMDGQVAIAGKFDMQSAYLNKDALPKWRAAKEALTLARISQPSLPDDALQNLERYAHETEAQLVTYNERQATEDADTRRQRLMSAVRAIEERQHRRVRELLAVDDPILKEMDQQIAALRCELLPRSEPS